MYSVSDATCHLRALTVSPVTDYPKLALFVLAVGGFSVVRFALKTLIVLAQTFVIPGKSVRATSLE